MTQETIMANLIINWIEKHNKEPQKDSSISFERQLGEYLHKFKQRHKEQSGG